MCPIRCWVVEYQKKEEKRKLCVAYYTLKVGENYTFGKSSKCNIILKSNQEVSQEHFMLLVRDDKIFLKILSDEFETSTEANSLRTINLKRNGIPYTITKDGTLIRVGNSTILKVKFND